ncbi:MAG: GTP cyclohydrolase I [Anaeromyxobacter sp.]
MPASRPRVRRREAAAAAVASFLDALPLPEAVRRSEDLRGTPGRVADAWLDELVDGYGQDPAAILAGAIPTRSGGLVAVTGITFHSVCPHHLLPSRGVAHLAYLPGGKVVGFGQLVRLVDALAHRLVLQEDLALEIAEALIQHLGARGAGVVLEAEQLCLTVRGETQPGARAHAQAFAGELAREPRAQRALLDAIGRAAAAPSAGRGRAPAGSPGAEDGPAPARTRTGRRPARARGRAGRSARAGAGRPEARR